MAFCGAITTQNKPCKNDARTCPHHSSGAAPTAAAAGTFPPVSVANGLPPVQLSPGPGKPVLPKFDPPRDINVGAPEKTPFLSDNPSNAQRKSAPARLSLQERFPVLPRLIWHAVAASSLAIASMIAVRLLDLGPIPELIISLGAPLIALGLVVFFSSTCATPNRSKPGRCGRRRSGPFVRCHDHTWTVNAYDALALMWAASFSAIIFCLTVPEWPNIVSTAQRLLSSL